MTVPPNLALARTGATFNQPLRAALCAKRKMVELKPNEMLIEGKWIFDGSSMHADESCQRIEWLISNKLTELTVNGDGWESLYQDPKDQRYWLLTYPESHIHGGGPPLIKVITQNEAQDKLNVQQTHNK